MMAAIVTVGFLICLGFIVYPFWRGKDGVE